ncbi:MULTISPECIES: cytochrome c [unclassified Sphingobacterium]|nr:MULTISPECIES: cytochrome c [unclassified Sphingobacterium]
MQHNARDPLRDHVHGRIYRITYPSRPLVKPAKIDGASIDELLENLKLPEIRTRYRTRTELRMRDNDEVAKKAIAWAEKLDTKDPKYLHNLLEAMWVTWGANKINADLVQKLLESNDYHARAAAIHAIRYNTDKIKNYKDLMAKATKDENGRVKLELIAAASWLSPNEGIDLMNAIDTTSLDKWNKPAYLTSVAHLNNKSVKEKNETSKTATKLTGPALEQYRRGAVIYAKEGFCVTCHQPNGKGLDASGFPPLNASKWVTGSEDRLIKLTLNGLLGPIEVNGKKYPGQVPMTPFGMMLNDQEIADVLTYVRNSFTNEANPISAAKVKEIRESIKDKKGFYTPDELLKEHPLEK